MSFPLVKIIRDHWPKVKWQQLTPLTYIPHLASLKKEMNSLITLIEY